MHPLLQSAALAISSALLSGIWQGLLLTSAVAVCLRRVPRTTPALRFSIWTLVLLLVAMLPVVEHLRPTPSSSAAWVQIAPRWAFAIYAASIAVAGLSLALSLLRGVSLASSALRLVALCRRARPLPLEPAYAALRHRGRPVLYTSTELDRPGVVGFFTPRILLPAGLVAQLTPPELEQIVLHETEHLRRRDDWLNLLQKLSLVLFPLNPVLLWVERRLCIERELACDEAVLRRTQAPRAYATCLAALAERALENRPAGRALSLALGTLGSKGRRPEIAARVHRILGYQGAAPLSRRARLTVAALFVGLLCGAAELTRCPRILAIADPPQIAASLPSQARSFTRSQGSTLQYAEAPERPARLVAASLRPTAQRQTSRGRHHFNRHHPLPGIPVASIQKHGLPASVPTLQLIDAESQPMLVHYAVVPSPEGWIIVQLIG